jgi:AcrR family transcriptional regulator
LLMRWGYDKTTVDDISRQADVAKGTIYLHWKTRDDLFEALIQREGAAVAADIQRRILQDHEGWTLRGVVKHTALATMKRPLIKALFLRDRGVIGKLAQGQHSQAAYIERVAGFKTYLAFLRQHDLVRKDIGLLEQVYIWSASLTGFLLAAPLMPPEFTFSDEVMADLLAETVHRTLEMDRPISPDEKKEIAEAFTEYMERTMASAVDRLPKENEVT